MERSQRFNDNRACVRAWMQQYDLEGHTANVFFEGHTLYSYGRHYPLATLYRGVVFVNDRYYSRTTARHKGLVLDAAGNRKVFLVSIAPRCDDPAADMDFINGNIRHWLGEIKECLSTLAAHPKRRSLYEKASRQAAIIHDFVGTLGVTPRVALSRLLEQLTLRKITGFITRYADTPLVRMQSRAADPHVRYAWFLKRWERREIASIPAQAVPPDMVSNAHLRYNPITHRIETSKDIQMPAELCYRCWRKIQHYLSEKCQTPCSIPIHGYTVSTITEQFIIINCHRIPMQQVDKMAGQLGWNALNPQPGQ